VRQRTAVPPEGDGDIERHFHFHWN